MLGLRSRGFEWKKIADALHMTETAARRAFGREIRQVTSKSSREGQEPNRSNGRQYLLGEQCWSVRLSIGSVVDLTNQVKRLTSIDHSVGNQPLIESGQLAFMGASQGEQVTVRDLGGVQKTCRVYMLPVEQRQVVRPEGVTGQLPE